MTVEVSGEKHLKRIMKDLRETAGRRSFTSGAAESAKKLAKEIKAEIPSRYKGVRRAMGWRRLKAKEAPAGGAKVGGKVGKASKAKVRERDANRPGVGINRVNVHWFQLGTTERTQDTTGRSTGAMPPQMRPVKDIAKQNKATLKRAFAEGAWKQIKKEIKKGKAFA